MILTIYKTLILFYIIDKINSNHLSKDLNNNLDSISSSKFVENENDAMVGIVYSLFVKSFELRFFLIIHNFEDVFIEIWLYGSQRRTI
jgi:hypothetical protein